MSYRFYLVFVVFYFTVVLVFAVYLRGLERRNFYRICTVRIQQNRLKRELWQKQLRLESLINPAAISEKLGE